MRFLVLGATGMAGHVISIYLKEQGHDVTGFSRRKAPWIKSIEGDAFDDTLLSWTIKEGNYDVVVNAIGILNKDAEDRKDKATYLNAYLPHRLAAIAGECPTRIFHMSTDCVFAGNGGPYVEADTPNGQTFYDRSKALGELCDRKNLTFRNSIIGPDIDPKGIGLLNWFMQQEGPVNGFAKAMWTGLSTLELAKAMECAASGKAVGLVNMVPEGNISKYELLKLFNESMRNGSVEIAPADSLVLDKTLVRTDMTCSYKPSSYSQQVAELAAWMRKHRELYPHYNSEGQHGR